MPRVAWLLLLGVLSACSPEDPDTLRLLVASSAIEPARQIAAQYQQQSGIPVLVIAASSGALVRQVENGLRGDVVLLASPDWMQRLESHSSIASETRRVPFGNRLVIATRLQTVSSGTISLEGDPPEGRWVIGIPSSVPVGKHAKAALQTLGWWEQVKTRSVMAADARAACAHVRSGSVDLGLLWASDARGHCQVLAEIPEQISGPITYPAACISNRAGSRELLAWLCDSPIWIEAGFIPHVEKKDNR